VLADRFFGRVAGDPLGFTVPVDDNLIAIDQKEATRHGLEQLISIENFKKR
jgi:hypothetical protein